MSIPREHKSNLRRLLFALILSSTLWLSALSANIVSIPSLESPIEPCGPLLFALGSAEISNEDEKCLLELAMVLNNIAPEVKLVIDGHRHWSEDKSLSRIRATNARDHLIYEKGVDTARLIVRDFDDTCPYETGDVSFNPRVKFWYLQEGQTIRSISKRMGCVSGAKPKYGILK